MWQITNCSKYLVTMKEICKQQNTGLFCACRFLWIWKSLYNMGDGSVVWLWLAPYFELFGPASCKCACTALHMCKCAHMHRCTGITSRYIKARVFAFAPPFPELGRLYWTSTIRFVYPYFIKQVGYIGPITTAELSLCQTLHGIYVYSFPYLDK